LFRAIQRFECVMKVKAKKLRELATDELQQACQDRMKEYFDLRKAKATGKLDNPLQLRQIRRTIARIKTILNERAREKAVNKRMVRIGFVISHKMRKTIVVRVERRVRHPLYGKEMRIARKMYAHDEKDEAKVGDKVVIAETRPLSKLKRWRLVKILSGGRPAVQHEEIS